MADDTMSQPHSILIAALGGQGGGVLAEWLVEAATRAGYPAQSTSIPGVAQRTGATTYYVEVYPEPIAALGGRAPILGLYPVPGGIDLLEASEVLEAGRMVQSGMVSPDRTTLVTSTSRALTTSEKMALGDGRFESDKLLEVARTHSRRLVAFDMDLASRETGTIVSAVMGGAIAGCGVLPFGRDAIEAVIRDSGLGVEASLRGFARGFDATAIAQPRESGDGRVATAREDVATTLGAAFPLPTQDMVSLGCARLIEFQDQRYADLYLQRLQRILAAEKTADRAGVHGYALTRETARFLALWMAFDDIMRVASLKCRASRFARVRREVAARPGDIVRIVDYFKPGVPEFAGMLPPALAQRLVAWDKRRQAGGKPPFAFALRLRADSVVGFVMLRTLASLAGLRRRGARYAQEQVLIERWLGAIEAAARGDWRLAHELALCGRLIKGYGATNERGKHNLAHILDHLAIGGTFADTVARAEAIRQAREAALAAEGGKAHEAALVKHGAPPRPIVARPVVWMRKPVQRDPAPAP
jgi:indolepyruvate ferredoxin oxidoreductase beta subunit